MNTRSRLARPADRDTLRAMTVEAFQGVSIDHAIERVLGPVQDLDWKARKARHVDDDLDAPDGEVLVAEDLEGRPLGYVSLRFDRTNRVGQIPNLVVAAQARGQGLGRQLLEWALDRFKQQRMAIVRIETLEPNLIGRHLYPSVGFIEVVRQIHYALRLDEQGPQEHPP